MPASLQASANLKLNMGAFPVKSVIAASGSTTIDPILEQEFEKAQVILDTLYASQRILLIIESLRNMQVETEENKDLLIYLQQLQKIVAHLLNAQLEQNSLGNEKINFSGFEKIQPFFEILKKEPVELSSLQLADILSAPEFSKEQAEAVVLFHSQKNQPDDSYSLELNDLLIVYFTQTQAIVNYLIIAQNQYINPEHNVVITKALEQIQSLRDKLPDQSINEDNINLLAQSLAEIQSLIDILQTYQEIQVKIESIVASPQDIQTIKEIQEFAQLLEQTQAIVSNLLQQKLEKTNSDNTASVSPATFADIQTFVYNSPSELNQENIEPLTNQLTEIQSSFGEPSKLALAAGSAMTKTKSTKTIEQNTNSAMPTDTPMEKQAIEDLKKACEDYQKYIHKIVHSALISLAEQLLEKNLYDVLPLNVAGPYKDEDFKKINTYIISKLPRPLTFDQSKKFNQLDQLEKSLEKYEIIQELHKTLEDKADIVGQQKSTAANYLENFQKVLLEKKSILSQHRDAKTLWFLEIIESILTKFRIKKPELATAGTNNTSSFWKSKGSKTVTKIEAILQKSQTHR